MALHLPRRQLGSDADAETPTTSGPRRRLPKDTRGKAKSSGKGPEAGGATATYAEMPGTLVELLKTSLDRPAPVSTPETTFAQYVGQMAASLHPELCMEFQNQVRHISHTCNHKEYNQFTVQ